MTLELSDAVETTGDQDDDKEQQGVGQQAVDAEHHEDGGIVAREVGQIVVHTALDLAKVGGLGDTLDVQEFGDGTQVGKARAEGLRANAVEPFAEARGNRINGDLERHFWRFGGYSKDKVGVRQLNEMKWIGKIVIRVRRLKTVR